MVADNVNGMFEILGGLFVFLNVIKLHHDKKVRGVSMVTISFMTIWGFWNLVYYPMLGQWWSTVGAVFIALLNAVWLGQVIYYSKKEKHGNRC